MSEVWHSEAACKGISELFHKNWDDEWIDLPKAKETCATCPVRVRCLDYAIRAREFDGIWGGTLPYHRDKLHAERTVRFDMSRFDEAIEGVLDLMLG